MTEWLLRTATSAGRWSEPSPALPSQEEADRWLRVNVDNWMGALRHLSSAGRYAAVLDCTEAMHWFSSRWMHGPHWYEVFTLGAEAAAALGDPARQAKQVNGLAWVHMVPRQDLEATLRHTAQAMELATRSGATAQIALAEHNAAGALRRLGRLDEAIAAQTRAAQVFEAVGDAEASRRCRDLADAAL
ncbi:tetratricopeptide (TPR) repeat protein [Nonomuraea thailandensis]|uniref:Tetratricopeptide (TPR) repeat protein n=1 Tax=Nonomuraea thailandensis TaxID=1188745 RepID=A0A9X2JYZ1_9ACTN|nr:hypothetical protein [Nonomuraea thailandensis]MCP2354712.1 tetratricopeptide (TPR) repeat protein [Nonomuraea thailandensis]